MSSNTPTTPPVVDGDNVVEMPDSESGASKPSLIDQLRGLLNRRNADPGSLQGGTLLTRSLPSVNVISPQLLATYDAQRARRHVIVAIAATFGIAVLAFLVTLPLIMASQNHLDDAMAEKSQFDSEITRLRPVQQLADLVNNNQGQIDSALRQRVLYSVLVSQLDKAAPNGVRFESVNVSMAGESAAPAAGAAGATPASPCGVSPDPFDVTTAKVGCIQFTGTAAARSDIGQLLTSLTRDAQFTDPYVGNTSVDIGEDGKKAKVQFQGSVAITDQIFVSNAAASDTEVSPSPAPSPTTPAPQPGQ